MDSLLPLSEKLLKGFDYKDYFKKKKHGKSLFRIMKNLALNGPITNNELTSILIQQKTLTHDSLRPQQHTKPTKSERDQAYRLLKKLRDNSLVKISGKIKGKIQNNVNLYGLTDFGLLLTCFIDEAVYTDAETILRNYEPYDDKRKIVGIMQLVKDPIPELDVNELARTDRLTVFNSDKLKGVRNDEDLYHHFFNSLSWILYDSSAECTSDELENIRILLKTKGVFADFLRWLDDRVVYLKDRIDILEIELRNFQFTAKWLKES